MRSAWRLSRKLPRSARWFCRRWHRDREKPAPPEPPPPCISDEPDPSQHSFRVGDRQSLRSPAYSHSDARRLSAAERKLVVMRRWSPDVRNEGAAKKALLARLLAP